MAGMFERLGSMASTDVGKALTLAHTTYTARMQEHSHSGRAILETIAHVAKEHPAVFGIGAKVGVDGTGPGNGVVGVALAFGLVLLAIAYAFGPVSGAHVNPAVTLGMLLGRRMPTNEAVGYWIAQFLGAIAAAGHALDRVKIVTDQHGRDSRAADGGQLCWRGMDDRRKIAAVSDEHAKHCGKQQHDSNDAEHE